MLARGPDRDDEEAQHYHDLFKGIPLRRLDTAHGVSFQEGFGKPVSIGIAADPPEAESMQAGPTIRSSSTCPVCGEATVDDNRVPASVQPEFKNGFSYLLGVWVHPACLQACPVVSAQRGVPW